MSLDYEYATVDVDLLIHPKAIAAGVEAMGLWLWGMAWAHKTGSNGRLPKHVVLTAWGAPRATLLKLSRILIAAGLWLETEADAWTIWNYGKKNQSAEEKERRRSLGRERMRRMRTRKGDATCDASGDASLERHVIDRGPAPALDLVTSGSDLRSDAHAMPSWFEGSCDATAMVLGGEVPERPALWVRYLSSRQRKTWAMNHTDAVGWLAEVVKSDRAKGRSNGARNHVQSSENRAWTPPKDMP